MRSHIQPHMRWATGLLVDSTDLQDGNIEYINRGAPVNPKSLYLAQLCVRLGPQALANIGYR